MCQIENGKYQPLFTFTMLKYFLYKPEGFLKFEIIINVFVRSFRFILYRSYVMGTRPI